MVVTFRLFTSWEKTERIADERSLLKIMASFVVKNVSKNKFNIKTEFENFPVTFVNALRRIVVSEIPTVVIRNIEVLANTTQLPHEMVIHRMSLLPVNVEHTETNIIRDTKVVLRQMPDSESHDLTTDDFAVESGRDNIIMKDRDLGTPILFIRVRKGEEIHVKGDLAVELGSQVCNVSWKFHIDEERAKIDKERYVEGGGDARVFDNFYVQKSIAVDEKGRPRWIDLGIESVGVLKSKDILKLAVQKLRKDIDTWHKDAVIVRGPEAHVFSVTQDFGGHTIGALLQEVIYHSRAVSVVNYDVEHPLRPSMTLKFLTQMKPEDILKQAVNTIHDYCEIVENAL
jgi:DNA-directed RNA polymerase alpha subunit/DNA-directed RNA polymerase subunit L